MSQVIEIILPVFGILALGYASARAGKFDDHANRGLSLFVFGFALPLLLFQSIAAAELPAQIPWAYLAAYFGGTLATMALAMAVGRWCFGRRLDEQGVMALGAGFSNTSMLGIPLVLTAFGAQGALPMFILLAVHSLILLPIVTVAIETGRGKGQGLGKTLSAILRGLAGNPIILALAAGLISNLAGLSLPKVLLAVITPLGSAAVPCALFALGASMARYKVAGQLAEPLSLVAFKTVVHPALVWLLATPVFGLPDLWAAVATVLAAQPTGITAYLFGQRYQVVVESSATTILLSTGFSAVTLSVLVLLLVPS
ncbi:AEC family transporter [Denitromonas iodatirespirans]|uniref:AEC family transporter n=1 Tax=Denitromonas iodatirespirans TaxID=2795389 RepID=A0A944D6T5_DENI1|nr:AEC family transporter [Denitromonas iodatirespirans]MBT0959547.1 AEC family transporter [Denitromonas iodatirespirans]